MRWIVLLCVLTLRHFRRVPNWMWRGMVLNWISRLEALEKKLDEKIGTVSCGMACSSTHIENGKCTVCGGAAEEHPK